MRVARAGQSCPGNPETVSPTHPDQQHKARLGALFTVSQWRRRSIESSGVSAKNPDHLSRSTSPPSCWWACSATATRAAEQPMRLLQRGGEQEGLQLSGQCHHRWSSGMSS